MNQMLKDLYELFSIIGPSGKEEAVANYLEPRLRLLLDRVERDEYGNLLGELKVGSGKGKTILLSAHMDTVDFLVPGRRIEVDGLIYRSSRGILGGDDRAGIAIVLEVLRQRELHSFIVKPNHLPEISIYVVGMPPSWRKLMARYKRSDGFGYSFRIESFARILQSIFPQLIACFSDKDVIEKEGVPWMISSSHHSLGNGDRAFH